MIDSTLKAELQEMMDLSVLKAISIMEKRFIKPEVKKKYIKEAEALRELKPAGIGRARLNKFILMGVISQPEKTGLKNCSKLYKYDEIISIRDKQTLKNRR